MERRDPIENPNDLMDPMEELDFSEVDLALDDEADPDLAAWRPPGGKAFPTAITFAAIEKEDMGDDEDDISEPDEWDPFVSNEAQARFRESVRTWEYDTAFAAGTISSSKTYGILALIVELCIEYPETHALIVRVKYDSLKDTTVPDLEMLIPPEYIRKWRDTDCYLKNGSIIRCRSANEQADPKFIWLRGNKPDIGFVDECDGVSEDFMSAFQARIGIRRKRRNKLAKIVKAIMFLACNPNISWPKKYYSLAKHTPAKLKADRFLFQTFTIKDNAAHITEEKKAQWKRLMTPPMYKRFVLGSWDAMSDREQLFLFEDMDRCRALIPPKVDAQDNTIKHQKYLGVDPARFGPDKCAFLVMDGPNLHKLEYLATSTITVIADHVKRLMAEHGITPEHVTVDVTGLGAGVVDSLGAEHIWVNAHAGAAAPNDAAFYMENPADPASRIHMDNAAFSFLNKRAQSHWETMQLLRSGGLGGFDSLGWAGPLAQPGEEPGDEINLDETLRQDLAAIHYGFAKGSKAIQIEDKEEIKKRLHRSPDFADVLILAVDAYLHDSKKPSMEVFSF